MRFRLHTTFLVLTLLVVSATAWGSPTRFAVVVGHNRGDRNTTVPLKFAEKDAQKMAGVFSQLGGVKPPNLRSIVGEDAQALRKELQAINTRLSRLDRPSELFFYYSGHADQSDLQLGDTRFPLEELREYLEQSPADIRIAIIDACYSGSIIRDKGGQRIPAIDLNLADGQQTAGFAIITSSSADERSQESEELRGSFFTHFLASGMRGEADSSRDGAVTLEELYSFTYSKTLKRTYAAGAQRQHPTFDYRMTGSGSVVMAYPGHGTSRLVLPAEMEGNYLFYSPDEDTVLAEVDKKREQIRSLPVHAGTYEVYRRTDRALERVVVTVESGQSVAVPFGNMVKVSSNTLADKGLGPELTVGAKAGYQFFWDSDIRQRSLLPSVLGGLELRVENWLPYRLTPFLEILAGGGVGSAGDSTVGPLAQSFAILEGSAGLAWAPLIRPFRIELATTAGVFYVRRTVETSEFLDPVEDSYVTASPGISLLVSKELFRNFTLALQARTGYLYFREDDQAKHLGYSELFVSARLNL